MKIIALRDPPIRGRGPTSLAMEIDGKRYNPFGHEDDWDDLTRYPGSVHWIQPLEVPEQYVETVRETPTGPNRLALIVTDTQFITRYNATPYELPKIDFGTHDIVGRNGRFVAKGLFTTLRNSYGILERDVKLLAPFALLYGSAEIAALMHWISGSWELTYACRLATFHESERLEYLEWWAKLNKDSNQPYPDADSLEKYLWKVAYGAQYVLNPLLEDPELCEGCTGRPIPNAWLGARRARFQCPVCGMVPLLPAGELKTIPPHLGMKEEERRTLLEELGNIIHGQPLFPGDTISHKSANRCVELGWAVRNQDGNFCVTEHGKAVELTIEEKP